MGTPVQGDGPDAILIFAVLVQTSKFELGRRASETAFEPAVRVSGSTTPALPARDDESVSDRFTEPLNHRRVRYWPEVAVRPEPDRGTPRARAGRARPGDSGPRGRAGFTWTAGVPSLPQPAIVRSVPQSLACWPRCPAPQAGPGPGPGRTPSHRARARRRPSLTGLA